MVRASLRRACAAVIIGSTISACSDRGATVTPAAHQASAARTTHATFTIKWSAAKAAAAVRGTKAISPSAQSISVAINGTLNTVANRTSGSTQSISLVAPVGNDSFVFDVYDGTNAQGNLLGSATVTQDIIDGAANVVTAAIDAVCTATNVTSVGDDPLAYVQTSITGVNARTVSSIVLAGQSTATLVIEPQDVDGNVIISGTAGTVAHAITGSATVTAIDGSHISLTPLSGPRNTTPDTLTVAAPTCPQASVAVQHSPAIYVAGSGAVVKVYDWFGDLILSGAIHNGDALIGYDTVSHTMMAYNSNTGSVASYPITLTSRTPQFTIPVGSSVTWSNFLHSVFAGITASNSVQFYTYANSALVDLGTPVLVQYAISLVAASPLSTDPFGYASGPDYSGQGKQTILQLSLSSPYSYSQSAPGTGGTTNAPYGLVVDDADGDLFGYYPGQSTQRYTVPLNFSAPAFGSFGITTTPQVVGIDTDADNLYVINASGGLFITPATAASSSTTPLATFSVNVGTPSALVIVSTNEH